jgi:hypothetical protein
MGIFRDTFSFSRKKTRPSRVYFVVGDFSKNPFEIYCPSSYDTDPRLCALPVFKAPVRIQILRKIIVNKYAHLPIATTPFHSHAIVISIP